MNDFDLDSLLMGTPLYQGSEPIKPYYDYPVDPSIGHYEAGNTPNDNPKTVWESISGGFDAVTDNTYDAISGTWDTIADAGSGLVEKTGGFFSDLGEGVVDIWDGAMFRIVLVLGALTVMIYFIAKSGALGDVAKIMAVKR